jgi:8-oxo-dGTP pyrophosphatase MutT (NUDIX family)
VKGKRAPREEVSAGGIVFRRSANGVRFLLIRDSYRNWGFPKGHLEAAESPDDAAAREVREETGLTRLTLVAPVDVIDWHFRFRGRVVHKVCHFYLIEATGGHPRPLRKEGITACRWFAFEKATSLVSYENARTVLARARAMLEGEPA